MPAKLVYDNGNESQGILIPSEMGTPRADQLLGKPLEQLSELACRVCYDSLGTGRPSFDVLGVEGMHSHLKRVNHGSVWEHSNFTVKLSQFNLVQLSIVATNRPGVWVGNDSTLTVNLRAVREWHAQGFTTGGPLALCREVGGIVQYAGNLLAPHIIDETDVSHFGKFHIVPPVADEPEERWITLFLSGSRGFSHEMVRHKWRTAVSQRSTRYCDESVTPWIVHPLLQEFLNENTIFSNDLNERELRQGLKGDGLVTVSECAAHYDRIIAAMQPWLESRGLSKLDARKQARGAARGYLGNALNTEMIFSASVTQWRRIFEQRCNAFADAEIREVMTEARDIVEGCIA